MSKEPAIKEVQTPVESQHVYESVGKAPTSRRTAKTKPETVPPTQTQQDSLAIALKQAQEDTRNAKASIVRDASKAIASEILNDIQNTTAVELITGLTNALTGERGAGTVLRGFLSTTTLSTYQPLDEVAKLETTEPIALQMFKEMNLLAAA